ncbi:MAG: serine hydrolase domain-containing protein, partial [Mycobacterium sp.]
MPAALDILDDWPVDGPAAAVVGQSGVLAEHGDIERPFLLASVTKPLVARAVQVAVEEGAVELDTAAGPPGSTVRHLLAHASGLAMHSDQVLAKPGTRRIYSNHGFAVLADMVQQGSGIDFGRYLSEAVFEPLGMTASRLDGGASAAGFGATSTVADLAAFAGDLLRPMTVSAQLHAEAIT